MIRVALAQDPEAVEQVVVSAYAFAVDIEQIVLRGRGVTGRERRDGTVLMGYLGSVKQRWNEHEYLFENG